MRQEAPRRLGHKRQAGQETGKNGPWPRDACGGSPEWASALCVGRRPMWQVLVNHHTSRGSPQMPASLMLVEKRGSPRRREGRRAAGWPPRAGLDRGPLCPPPAPNRRLKLGLER